MRRSYRLLRGLALVPALAWLGMPLPARAIDCAKATTANDKAVCAAPELRAADAQLQAAYQALFDRLDPAARRRLVTLERGWLKNNKAACAFGDDHAAERRACLARLYATRIAELGGPAAPRDPNDPVPVVAGFPAERAPPAVALADWLARLTAARSLDALTTVIAEAQPGFAPVLDPDDFKVDGALPPIGAEADEDHLGLAVHRTALSLPPAGALTAVMLHLTRRDPASAPPEWTWLGLFRDAGAGAARLVGSFQAVAETCGFVGEPAFALDDAPSGLHLTQTVAASCGTYVESHAVPIECFMPDDRLACVSGANGESMHFDRTHPDKN